MEQKSRQGGPLIKALIVFVIALAERHNKKGDQQKLICWPPSLAPRAGLEPATIRLTAERSTS